MRISSLQDATRQLLWRLSGSGRLPPNLAPRVAVTNLNALFGLALLLALSCVQAASGLYWIVATNQISTATFVAILVLGRLGKHRASRVLTILYLHAALFTYTYLWGIQTGLVYFYFPLIVVPFFLFTVDEPAEIIGLCSLGLIVGVPLLLFGGTLVPGVMPLAASVLGSMRLIYTVGAVISLMLPVVVNFVVTQRQERALRDEQAGVMQLAKLKALGEMAGGIAHEINNPLAVIQGKVHQIRRLDVELTREQLAKCLTVIHEMTNRIAGVVSSILQLSRDTSMRQSRPVSVRELIARTLMFCQESFAKQGTELRVKPLAGAETVVGEMAQLSQALLGLLHNALDATAKRAASWVEVGYAVDGLDVLIYVVDSGAGVPAPLRTRIMEPFFSTKDVGDGTGLGLSIASAIVVSHGGRLVLDTASEHTRFVIRLPARPQA